MNYRQLRYFSFDLYEWYCQSLIMSEWNQTHYDVTDKKNNDSFVGLDIQYH
jgi:hypothetical protein